MTTLSCDDVVARLVSDDAPVLLLDTCIILDIVRAPIREPIGVHDIKAIRALLTRMTQTPSAVSFVITEQVKHEFLENIDAVEKETLAELRKAEKTFKGILARMAALSPVHSIPSGIDLLSLGFPERGRQLAERIVKKSIVLKNSNDDKVNAVDRVRRAKPPARRGKESVKDCLITESYLRLARSLQSVGFFRNVVFATSNTKDYQQGQRNLHPALRMEFSAVGLEYSPCWSAARHELEVSRT